MQNQNYIARLNWLLALFLVVWIVFLPSSCREKKNSYSYIVSESDLIIDTSGITKLVGLYVTDGFESNLKWFDTISTAAKVDSIFEVIIENAAIRDTSGSWKITDATKALEALYQLYLQQIKDKIKITK